MAKQASAMSCCLFEVRPLFVHPLPGGDVSPGASFSYAACSSVFSCSFLFFIFFVFCDGGEEVLDEGDVPVPRGEGEEGEEGGEEVALFSLSSFFRCRSPQHALVVEEPAVGPLVLV